jgi:hypothetical protein
MKNSSDPIGNQTRNLPACSAVPLYECKYVNIQRHEDCDSGHLPDPPLHREGEHEDNKTESFRLKPEESDGPRHQNTKGRRKATLALTRANSRILHQHARLNVRAKCSSLRRYAGVMASFGRKY